MDAPHQWHATSAAEACRALGVAPGAGLGSDEAARRLATEGKNELEEARRRTLAARIAGQLADPMIVVLLAAAVVSGLVGDLKDTVAILVIVLLNGVIGTIQELRAERAILALRRLAAPVARVVRDGVSREIGAAEVVPGDLMQLVAGDIVTADARILSSAGLRVDEAPLTGESQPVDKHAEPLAADEPALGDRANMTYRGTLVTGGRGEAVVVATGMRTELGRIAGLLQREESARTPLQRRLARFGKNLAWAVLAICTVVFASGLARGEPLLLMFLTSVSLAVAAIPEALPAVVSISLALGARKMVRRHALVRNLPAVETLGSVTYVCSDKTGTITRNEMRAEAFFAAGRRVEQLPRDASADEPWDRLAQAVTLNNDAHRDDAGELVGDPTEIALLAAAEAAGHERAALEQRLPRVHELPFDGDRKRMTTVHRDGREHAVFVKGAPEAVLARCVEALGEDGPAPLDVEAVLADAAALAAEGFRVLAFAWRTAKELPEDERLESELAFLGLVALLDPPREEAAAAVAQCRSAGIVPVMITGDHPATARAIAQRVGIAGEEDDGILTGREMLDLTPEDLAQRVCTTRVYARVSSEQKIDIVRALQEGGQFVAMTGDGVNDAPALKRAEIGIAMGRKGTAVAREAADMVLLDDDFATIVAAVREGRRVFDNIRKFVKYTLTSNAGEVWTLFLAPFLGLPLPLLPIQILWINLVTDGLPGLALAVEPEEPDIMRRPPRPPTQSVLAGGLWQHVVWVGLLIGALSIGAQAWALDAGSASWQTMVFTVLTFCQLAHALAIRSERESLFSIGPASNLPLLGALTLTVLLQLAVVYAPPLHDVFKTVPLAAHELLVCFAVPLIVFFGVELEKLLVRTGRLYRGGNATS